MTSPRIVYMGTPDFAVEPLKAIVDAGYNVVAVVTVPDKPVGRGQKLQSSPVKQYAEEKGLLVLQPEKLRNEDFVNQLKELNPDIAVVVAFRMLPETVWSLPKIGTFNLHASLLPQYRGAAPINWAVINGEKKTGLTTFLLDKEIDTGNIIDQLEVLIDENETAGELHDKLMLLGGSMVVKTIQKLAEGNYTPTPQKNLAVGELKAAPKIFKETCKVDWGKSYIQVHNFIRGLSPYPAAWSEMVVSVDGAESLIPVKIFKTSTINQSTNNDCGFIKTDGKKYLQVTCQDGLVDIHTIQQAGKKAMQIDEFLRGWHNAKFLRMV
ncbi:MAG TPA: methionyl-tRNA formyltransferase [Tenuifilaceae bacterium]|nr:methionyl-tRNA formyltransferase [Tenuifilaceae bacterium]HPI44822.1 methionyl-tRNA formyltransferase [Tenuifilaceae bacterium]HPN20705.1 methionyl-tRNA formyltransferase [Tenuifilaceae bacterium]HPV55530.1 methionyl-tRNA formyltransferase [Tenuifilaceae bacterium]